MRAFIGFGDLGQQVAELLTPEMPDDVYFDDLLHEEGDSGALPFSRYLEEAFRDYEFYVCLGYRQMDRKLSILRELEDAGRHLPVLIHNSCQISVSSSVGVGSILYPRALLDKEVRIGRGVLLNNAVTVSHNSEIGDASYLSPGVTMCGNVRVGERTFIGAGSVISDGVSIGHSVTVGIGTVVTRDIPSGVSVIGNPMRVLDGTLSI